MSASTTATIGVHEMELEVAIKAPVNKVWKALTSEIGTWWPRSFHIGGETARFCLEARPGGRLFEDWGDDAGLLWGTVNTVEPEKLLRISSDHYPEYGGPARSFVTWRLEVVGDATTVRFSESMIGAPSPGQHEDMIKGWEFLLACLGAHVEGRPEPEWK